LAVAPGKLRLTVDTILAPHTSRAPRPALKAGASPAAWLTALFAVDMRALAAMRVGLGMLLLADMVNRAIDLSAHYSDAGVLSRTDRLALHYDGGLSPWLSLHMLSGSVWWAGALLLLAAGLAVCLAAGYRTGWAVFGSWLLLVGLHARNPLVLQGGDILLRCQLFWCLFLPLGAVWSIDSGRSASAWPARTRFVSAATAALLAQLAMMYMFSAALKTDPSWRREFSAIYYALHYDHFTSPLGYRLLEFPRLLAPLTAATWLLEWCGPLMLFCPVWNARVRIAVVTAFVGLHLGLAATMELGLFPYYCIVYWLTFLPSEFWDWLTRTRLAAPSPLRTESRAWVNVAAAVLLLYVLLLNVRRLDGDPFAPLGRPPLSEVSRITGLDQCWNMFASGPHQFGGWLSMQGTLADGTRVNLWRGEEPIPDTRPDSISGMYPTHRWRRLLLWLFEVDDPVIRKAVACFLRQRWQERHPNSPPVARVELINVLQHTPPSGEGPRPARRTERMTLLRQDFGLQSQP
jgi:hypothetical protein